MPAKPSAWTPGPWHVSDSNEVLDEQSLLVAAEIMGERPEIYKANARLIAAAPEMAETLQTISDIAAYNGCAVSTNPRMRESWEAARKVLAKATGGAE